MFIKALEKQSSNLPVTIKCLLSSLSDETMDTYSIHNNQMVILKLT